MPTFTAPSNAARLQVGTMDFPMESAFTNLLRGSPAPAFSRPGAETAILPADCSPEGWPNATDFNGGVYGGSGVGLPIDPLMVGLVRFKFRGRCDSYFNVAGNASAIQYAYDPATDLTTGSFVTAADGASYARLEFRGASFLDADGIRKPGLRDLEFLRPRSPGNLTQTYDSSTPFTDNFLAYLREFDYIRFFIAATGLADWEGRTPPTWWNQILGTTGDSSRYPAYLKTLRPGSAPLGPSFETMIAMANAADRNLLMCFPPNATADFMRKWVKCVLYGTDAQGMPYDGPVSNPVHPPLKAGLKVTVEGGLEPWNFSSPYRVDMMSYCDLATYHYQQGDEVGRAITYGLDMTGWPASPDPERHAAFMSVVPRMRVMQLIQIADAVREIAPSALHTRIRTLFSPQLNGMDADALKWHESYFGKVDPNSPYSGTPRDVRDDITLSGAQGYWSYADEQGLTDAVADPSFATPAVAVGYSPRPAGGSWTFTGDAGVARSNGADIPPAYAGQQVGYVGDGGEATAPFVVPSDGTMAKYDIKFKAVRRAADAGVPRFKVFLDRGTPNERDITPRSIADPGGSVAPRAYGDVLAVFPASSWPARRVYHVDSEWYTTPVLDLVPGTSHTVTIVGVGGAGTCVFLGAVRVGSADVIAGSAHPVVAGVTNATVDQWAAAQSFDSTRIHGYGLGWHNYETAPGFGGDDHGTDLQQFVRYLATGMTAAQLDTYAIQAGLGLGHATQGVFHPIPSWSDPSGEQGLLDPGKYAIIKAIRQVRAGNLAVTYRGTALPGTLNWANRDYEDTVPHNSYLNRPGSTITWRVVVANPGVYRLTLAQVSPDVANKGPTSTDLMVDGRVAANGGDSVVAEVGLPAGPHWIRLRQRSGDSGEGTITVARIADLPASGPATAYALTLGSSRAVGTPIPVTATLIGGDPLGTNLAITLACPGASVAGTITIPAGQASGSGSITPTAAGTFAVSATNDGGLANPGPLSLAFTAVPNPQPGKPRVILFRR